MPGLQRLARRCHEWHSDVMNGLAPGRGPAYASTRRGWQVTLSTIGEPETNTKAASADLASTPFRLSRRELVLIVAFWTFIAALTFANRLLDPRQLGFQFTNASAPIAVAFLSAYSWALLTPLVFWLSSRFLADDGHRVVGALDLVAVGFAIAVTLGIVGDEVRSALMPFPPRRGGGGGPPGFFWLRPWYLNDFITYLGVLAAGLARAY